MKKTIVLATIALIVVSVAVTFKIVEVKNNNIDAEPKGKLLLDMEKESDLAVQNLINEIQSDQLQKDDCKMELQEIVYSITDAVSEMDATSTTYVNIMYNCNIIRKLSGLMNDKKKFEPQEIELRTHELTQFCDTTFNHCLNVHDGMAEPSDQIKINDKAKSITDNLTLLIDEYSDLLYENY